MAYQTTKVTVENSQGAIRKLLIAFGARGIQFSEDFTTSMINIRFAKEVNSNLRTVSVTLRVPEPPKKKREREGTWRRGKFIPSKSIAARREQMMRATYRALHWWLKSQFEAVEFGLLSFDEVFLSHFEWMIDGARTIVGAVVLPHLSNGSSFLPAPRDPDVLEGQYTAD